MTITVTALPFTERFVLVKESACACSHADRYDRACLLRWYDGEPLRIVARADIAPRRTVSFYDETGHRTSAYMQSIPVFGVVSKEQP